MWLFTVLALIAWKCMHTYREAGPGPVGSVSGVPCVAARAWERSAQEDHFVAMCVSYAGAVACDRRRLVRLVQGLRDL